MAFVRSVHALHCCRELVDFQATRGPRQQVADPRRAVADLQAAEQRQPSAHSEAVGYWSAPHMLCSRVAATRIPFGRNAAWLISCASPPTASLWARGFCRSAAGTRTRAAMRYRLRTLVIEWRAALWTKRVLFVRGGQKKLRCGAAAEGIGRLRVAASGAAVSVGVAGKCADLVWSAGRDLRECWVVPVPRSEFRAPSSGLLELGGRNDSEFGAGNAELGTGNSELTETRNLDAIAQQRNFGCANVPGRNNRAGKRL